MASFTQHSRVSDNQWFECSLTLNLEHVLGNCALVTPKISLRKFHFRIIKGKFEGWLKSKFLWFNFQIIWLTRISGRYLPLILVAPRCPNLELKFYHYRMTDTQTLAPFILDIHSMQGKIRQRHIPPKHTKHNYSYINCE